MTHLHWFNILIFLEVEYMCQCQHMIYGEAKKYMKACLIDLN